MFDGPNLYMELWPYKVTIILQCHGFTFLLDSVRLIVLINAPNMDSAEPKKMDDVPARHEQEFNAKPDNISVDITAEQNGNSQQSDGDRKRKRDGNDHGRGSRRGDKRKDMGRGDWQYASSGALRL